MKQTFAADISKFVELTQAKLRKVAMDSISDVMEGAMTSAKGVSAGGVRIEGRIPVVSGDLINSLTSGIDGSGGAVGAMSYATVIAGMELGDTLTFEWNIEYAARVEFGFTGTDSLGRTYQQPGWHFVGRNAAMWPEIVEKNVRLVK